MERYRPQGCILGYREAIAFLALAHSEGFVRCDSTHDHILRDLRKIKNRHKTRVLTNALIYGGLDLMLPNEAHPLVHENFIERLGIDAVAEYPIDFDDVNWIGKICRTVFRYRKKLESAAEFTGLWDIATMTEPGDYPAHDRSHEVDALLDDYWYYAEELIGAVGFVDKLASPLFREFVRIQAAASDVVKNVFGVRIDAPQVDPWNMSSQALLDEMHLWANQGVSAIAAQEKDRPQDPIDMVKLSEIYNSLISWNKTEEIDRVRMAIDLQRMGTEYINDIVGFWLAWLEFRQITKISAARSSVICLHGTVPAACVTEKNGDKLQLYRIFTQHVNRIPRISSFSDFVRLYHDPALNRFREQLVVWSDAVAAGENRIITRMRRDFDLALDDLSKVAEMKKVGGCITIVALPVAIGGLLCGLPIDFGFTAVGPAINLKANRLLKRASWAKFGSL